MMSPAPALNRIFSRLISGFGPHGPSVPLVQTIAKDAEHLDIPGGRQILLIRTLDDEHGGLGELHRAVTSGMEGDQRRALDQESILRQDGVLQYQISGVVVDRDFNVLPEARAFGSAIGLQKTVIGHGQERGQAVQRAEDLVGVLDKTVCQSAAGFVREHQPGLGVLRRLEISG